MASTSNDRPVSANVTAAQSPPSDNDGGERPVRQQLQETTIESTSQPANESSGGRKRSFEESRENDDSPADKGESRKKRSRENTPDNSNAGEAAAQAQMSKKRSRENTPDDTNIEKTATQVTTADTQTVKVSENEPKDQATSAPKRNYWICNGKRRKSFHDDSPETDVDFSPLMDRHDASAERAKESDRPNTSYRDAATQADQDSKYPNTSYHDAATQTDCDAEFPNPSLHDASTQTDADSENHKSSLCEAATQTDVDSEYPQSPPCGASTQEEVDSEHPQSPSCGASTQGELPDESDTPLIPTQRSQSAPAVPTTSYASSWYMESPDASLVGAQSPWFIGSPLESPTGVGCGSAADNDHASCAEPRTESSLGSPVKRTYYGPFYEDDEEDEEIPPDLLNTSETPHLEPSLPPLASTKGPSKKRSLGEYQADSPKASELTDTTTKTPEPEKKRHRDNSQEPETKTDKVCRSSLAKLCETLTDSCHQVFAASAFGKAAGASPFASLGKKLEPTNADSEKKTSASTFASSSLAGFAGSEKSPFSTLGASTPSIFKPAASSGFGSLGSGFSGVGGGFSGAAKSGGLTSFASNSPVPLGGTPTSQPKENPAADESESANDSEQEKASTFKAEKTDDRFYEQEMATGEEEELTSFSCKAKLFKFLDGEWRERGIGTFKVNCRYDHGRLVGRMIMRADGALRVMLNSPVFKGMKYGDSEGKPPKSKQLFLGSMEEGRLVSCLLRTGKQETAEELYKVLGDLLESEREGGEGSEEEEEGEEEEKAEK
ncbi:hypothetical protein N7468_005894 [Penicillium chermesinum]|uniref:RanBD1 domain-containing protein n=1 Tax=Penicillium chermesinum TaxID=63820 RepID=A0A9W9P055_9EURO|nr:uncharacterized protein N7468_005894 [Penicillium chermesinum]KAJ5232938.1 hypothetical protein N7468_005894 [Penicillium chermesinum]